MHQSSIRVVNLHTGETAIYVDMSPRQAVIAAYIKDTGHYDDSVLHYGSHSIAAGHYAAWNPKRS